MQSYSHHPSSPFARSRLLPYLCEIRDRVQALGEVGRHHVGRCCSMVELLDSIELVISVPWSKRACDVTLQNQPSSLCCRVCLSDDGLGRGGSGLVWMSAA